MDEGIALVEIPSNGLEGIVTPFSGFDGGRGHDVVDNLVHLVSVLLHGS